MEKIKVLLFICLFLNISLAGVEKDTIPQFKNHQPGSVNIETGNVAPRTTMPLIEVIKSKEEKEEKKEEKKSIFLTLLPIVTLILGIVLNKLYDYFSTRQKTKKVRRRWIAELIVLEDPINQQIEQLDSFQNNLTEANFHHPNLVLYPNLDCGIFKTLDKSEFLNSIELIRGIGFKKAVKILNSTNGYISILSNNFDNLKEKFGDFSRETSKHISSFSENLQSLRKALGDYAIKLEVELGVGNLSRHGEFVAMEQLFLTHIQSRITTGDYNPFEMEQDFFQPLFTILAHLRHDNRTEKMWDITSDCFTNIAALRMERRYLTENFDTIKTRYRELLVELQDIINELKK